MTEKNTYGIIITIENYNNISAGLPTVKYASSDGEMILSIFNGIFAIPKDNTFIYKDSQCTLATFQHELPYHIKSFKPNSTVYVYYAGHGFFSNGHNYLTAFDTTCLDLEKTSISVEDLFLDKLRTAQVKECITFLDACAEFIDSNTRGISPFLRSINKEAFEASLKQTQYSYACFFSCSPGEHSYSSNMLKHGIWTWCLKNALSQDRTCAYSEAGVITAASLKRYLYTSVRDYIEKSDEVLGIQTPYAIIASNDDQIIYLPTNNTFDFAGQLIEYETDFFNKCYLFNLVMGGYEADDIDVFDNYDLALEICWDIDVAGYFEEGWQDTFNQLRYHCTRIKEKKSITISYKEQEQLLKEIESFVGHIPDFEQLET